MRVQSVLAVAAAVALGSVAAPTLLAAQNSAPPTTQALLRDIGQLERKLIALAEALPEDKYGWKPGEGVRSVGEVLIHVAADNYFIPVMAGTPAPAATGIKSDYATVQAYEGRKATKAEAVQALRESFTHLRNAMTATDQAFLDRSMDVFGQKMAGLDLWVMTTTHLHEHLGQMIAYARSNGVKPPWSR